MEIGSINYLCPARRLLAVLRGQQAAPLVAVARCADLPVGAGPRAGAVRASVARPGDVEPYVLGNLLVMVMAFAAALLRSTLRTRRAPLWCGLQCQPVFVTVFALR